MKLISFHDLIDIEDDNVKLLKEKLWNLKLVIKDYN